MHHVEKSGAKVYLVNTGWTGGAYAKGGERYSIPTTRAIINAIHNGDIEKAELENFDGFNMMIPTSLPGVDSALLNPARTWDNQDEFLGNRNSLIEKFINNFTKFEVSSAIREAGPAL